MRVIMFALAVLAFLAGFAILASAKSAVHEIEAFVLYVVAAVLFAGAAIVDAIIGLPKRLARNEAAEASREAPVRGAAGQM